MNIDELNPHPEGGRYKEVYRSSSIISKSCEEKSALTHIYFSLNEGEVSKFHKVESDEVWNLYEGEGITLFIWDENLHTLTTHELSKKNKNYCHVVEAGQWQAAKPIGKAVLVGCTVAPGFEFQDFELIKPNSPLARQMKSYSSKLSLFI